MNVKAQDEMAVFITFTIEKKVLPHPSFLPKGFTVDSFSEEFFYFTMNQLTL